jgi:GntR family transcriptional regulator
LVLLLVLSSVRIIRVTDALIQQAVSLRQGAHPLYQGVAAALEDLIANGALSSGTRLPPERELADLCGLSRVTIRKAVSQLAAQGLLVQRQGSGTYVAQPAAPPLTTHLPVISLTEDLRRRGQSGRSVWLARRVVQGSERDCAALALDPGGRVVRLLRLRLANERPLSVERTILPIAALPDPSILGQSLYDTLALLGTRPVRVAQRISAINVSPRDAEMLGIFPATAALCISRHGYDRSGKIVEITEAILRGDSYDYSIELGLPAQADEASVSVG